MALVVDLGGSVTPSGLTLFTTTVTAGGTETIIHGLNNINPLYEISMQDTGEVVGHADIIQTLGLNSCLIDTTSFPAGSILRISIIG